MIRLTLEHDMKHVTIRQFQLKCLEIIDSVHTNGEGVIITKRGKAIATVMPFEEAEDDEIFGFLKGRANIVGDLINTIPIEDWDLGDDTNMSKAKGPTPRRPR